MLPFTGPAERTCPYCGAEEANAWLLSNNHWVPSQFVAERGICVAMDLTRNHVVHDVRRLAEARVEAAQQIQGRARKVAVRELEQATAALNRSVIRAREVWAASTWLSVVLTGAAADDGLPIGGSVSDERR